MELQLVFNGLDFMSSMCSNSIVTVLKYNKKPDKKSGITTIEMLFGMKSFVRENDECSLTIAIGEWLYSAS